MGLWPLRRPGTPRQPPAGEPRIFRCPIALVPSVNRVVREWPPARSENEDIPLLPFGDWIELPELGARARRAPGAGGTQVLVMEPTSADGWAARWLEEHGAGWIGFELPHLDLDATRSRLDSRGLRPRVMNDRAMWLPPSETGGALVVFAAGHGL
jgi:hypothetical protein